MALRFRTGRTTVTVICDPMPLAEEASENDSVLTLSEFYLGPSDGRAES